MESDSIYCTKCGAENEKNNNFCKKCGASLISKPGKPSAGWYLLPLLFSILGGIIGYIVLKAKDEKMAKNILYLGIGTFVLGIIVIAAIPSPPPSETEAPISTPKTMETFSPSPKPEVTPTPTPTPTAIAISAADLYWAYKANEIAADEQYEGKIVEVTGFINTIGKDILDTPYVTFEVGDVLGNVQCMFNKKDESQLSKLRKGQKITVRGRCKGYSIISVLIDDCTLV
jgi:hypothetical protein